MSTRLKKEIYAYLSMPSNFYKNIFHIFNPEIFGRIQIKNKRSLTHRGIHIYIYIYFPPRPSFIFSSCKCTRLIIVLSFFFFPLGRASRTIYVGEASPDIVRREWPHTGLNFRFAVICGNENR